jgi:ankyrin repeat protein
LDGTYERTLLNIDKENWVFAHRLFQCIVVASRPLRVEELAEFLAFKSEAGGHLTFQSDWRPENPRDTVLSTCSSLIAIVDVDGSAVMQFSHFSVKEYLTSSRISEGPVSRYYIPLESAHVFVTQACLSLLLQLDKHVTKTSLEELPLAPYAGQYWTDHAKFGNVSSHTEDLIKRVFTPEHHHFATWVWIYKTVSELPGLRDRAPLHYAAEHGFHRVVEWLITTCSQDVNLLCGSMAPLHITSALGQFAVAQVLLEHRANVNVATGYGWTPLLYASWNGHPKVARLLLEHGADVNSKDSLGETPLRLLSERGGDVEAARLLLDYGADPNVRSSSGTDSLYMALWRGHQGLVQLLLEHGADPNAQDVDGLTLLHLSSQRGELKVARGLLELGVEVNLRDNSGQTPLHVAFESGKGKVVQLLLRHGAK